MVQSPPKPRLSLDVDAYTLRFDRIGLQEVALVGGKGASLGEMYNNLTPLGVNVPGGFCVTAKAYRTFVASLESRIRTYLERYRREPKSSVKAALALEIQTLILNQEFPADMKQAIAGSYQDLCSEYGGEANLSVAVRSSSISEDGEENSFAGQHDSYLHQRGILTVSQAIRRCFASMFTPRAISYRENLGLDPLEDALPVVVQKMVYSDNAYSGVMKTQEPVTLNEKFMRIESSFGLGESVVQGLVNPDIFQIFKRNVRRNIRAVVSRTLGLKQTTMVHNSTTGQTETHKTSRYNRARFTLSFAELNLLAKWGLKIEDHYSSLEGKYLPMDIEWAKDEPTGLLFVVQARPMTVKAVANKTSLKQYKLLEENPEQIASGVVGAPGICTGTVRILRSLSELDTFQEGEILVTESTAPDWMDALEKCAGVITEQGGATCHASIVTRELGKPSIVGVKGILSLLETGQEITIDASRGSQGYVFAGHCAFDVRELSLENLPETKTNIYLNTAKPSEAMNIAALPVAGVGLLRSEFIINDIGVHPMALVKYDELDDETTDAISAVTSTYNKKTDYFIDEFALGIAEICASFYPRPVIVRLADLKSNEYSELLGGARFEPHEENPMMGWRGAIRYIDPDYREAFNLECVALRRVRESLELDNLRIMVPFCRSVREGQAVLDALAENGLERGKNGLQVYMMAELPNNVFLAQEYCEIFDGFSIGSNDLTQLVLGIDRDGGKLAGNFDETDPSVLAALQLLFDNVRKFTERTGQQRYIGICGQGPSNKPELVKWLLARRINSISLTQDAVFNTFLNVAEAEGQNVEELRRQLEW